MKTTANGKRTNGKITLSKLRASEPSTIELVNRSEDGTRIDFGRSVFLPSMILPGGREVAMVESDEDEPKRYKRRSSALTAAKRLLAEGVDLLARREAKDT
jgi:hypothetical protein